MGHGSQLAYKSQLERLNVFSFLHASLIATISAWAVGSFEKVTLFEPSAIIFSFLTIIVEKGPPFFLTFSTDLNLET